MDLDLLVAEADPARHADLPGPDSPGAARRYRQITAPGPGGRGLRHPGLRGHPGPQGRRVRRPILAAAAGLAAAAAVATLVITGLPAWAAAARAAAARAAAACGR